MHMTLFFERFHMTSSLCLDRKNIKNLNIVSKLFWNDEKNKTFEILQH